MAEIKEGETVCEPSAGQGKIARLLPANVSCFELLEENKQFLISNGFNVIGNDFLESTSGFDVYVANPPFSKQQDIDHVNKMIDLATRRVVSIMSASILFRSNKKTIAFRKRIFDLKGTIEILPEKTFAESGTNVKTCIVCVDVNQI